MRFCFVLANVNSCARDSSIAARESIAGALCISIMAPTNKNKTAKKSKPANKGRKVKLRRKNYSLKMKTFARQLKTIDKLSLSQIKKKFKEKFGVDVPSSTLSTWWNTQNMQVVANMPQDRLNVSDKRIIRQFKLINNFS